LGKKMLKREAELVALTRMEEAARTKAEWDDVVVQWDRLDTNREARERYHEVSRPCPTMLHWDRINPDDEKGKLRSYLEVVIPRPFVHNWWRQLLAGDFLDTIFDRPDDMWQLVEDWDVASLLLRLSKKQKEVLYLRAVRLIKASKIAKLQNKTDRAVRKLLVTTLSGIRDKLALIIHAQIESECPQMTYDKRVFLKEYAKEKNRNRKSHKMRKNRS